MLFFDVGTQEIWRLGHIQKFTRWITRDFFSMCDLPKSTRKRSYTVESTYRRNMVQEYRPRFTKVKTDAEAKI
jgi:hypothetical protein